MSDLPRILYVGVSPEDSAVGLDDSRFSVRYVSDGFDALVRLADAEFDAIVIEEPVQSMTTPRFVRRARQEFASAPVIVIGGTDDPENALQILDAGATDVVPADTGYDDVAERLHTVLDERRLDNAIARRRQLESMLLDIAQAAMRATTRSEIEGAVYDRLSANDFYRFAWVGEFDADEESLQLRWPQAGQFSPEAIATLLGVDDAGFILRAVSEGSVGVAMGNVKTRSSAVAASTESDTPGSFPSGVADDFSAAAIPLVHESTTYGLALVATTRPEAFSGFEREYLNELGTIVGDAIWLSDQRADATEHSSDRAKQVAELFAHQLRNPLGIATMYLEIAKDESDPEALDEAVDALDRLDGIIDGILTLARDRDIVAGEPVDIAEVVEGAWASLDTGAATLDINTETAIFADDGLLVQLLSNLFQNALTYGGDEVTIHVGALDDGFFVEDDGPGIPPERRESVFEWGFSTADNGTGFGLAIVQEIAEAHDWSVSIAESESGGVRVEVHEVETAANSVR